MKLDSKTKDELKNMSPEGVYNALRSLVREEFGFVDKEELSEALEDAVEAELLDERDLREIEREM